MHVPRGDTDTTLQDVGVAWEGWKGKEGRRQGRKEGRREGRKEGTNVGAHVSFKKLKAGGEAEYGPRTTDYLNCNHTYLTYYLYSIPNNTSSSRSCTIAETMSTYTKCCAEVAGGETHAPRLTNTAYRFHNMEWKPPT